MGVEWWTDEDGLIRDDGEDEARRAYNRAARAKAARSRGSGGWPAVDPIDNPDHPLYQPPEQRESGHDADEV
jgi:hypothetical protein